MTLEMLNFDERMSLGFLFFVLFCFSYSKSPTFRLMTSWSYLVTKAGPQRSLFWQYVVGLILIATLHCHELSVCPGAEGLPSLAQSWCFLLHAGLEALAHESGSHLSLILPPPFPGASASCG